jgi:hypothetical protein
MRNTKILAEIVLIASIGNSAFAGLMIELRAVPAPGCVTPIDAKTVMASNVGDKFCIQVWAQLSGSATDNYQFQSAQGYITETVPANYIAKGDFSWGTTLEAADYIYTPPFDANVLPTQTINAAGDKEIGTSGLNAFAARQGSLKHVSGDWFQIGLLTYTINTISVTGAVADTMLNFVPKTSKDTGAFYYVDDTKYSGNTNASGSGTGAPYAFTAGASIRVTVPEPTTLVLLGMGALALVFVRRCK